MQTWHDGLPTPNEFTPPLPERPRVRSRPNAVPTQMSAEECAGSFDRVEEQQQVMG